ncbi:unnamed protein product, partial [Hapterophycus canaliculatus]
CHKGFRGNQGFFACRSCGDVFHATCAGYNSRGQQQFPPPDWICPRCPDGE